MYYNIIKLLQYFLAFVLVKYYGHMCNHMVIVKKFLKLKIVFKLRVLNQLIFLNYEYQKFLKYIVTLC